MKRKPFNLEAAKAGRPVMTLSGRHAKILAFDLKDPAPILAILGPEEEARRYNLDGKMMRCSSSYDLVMCDEYLEFHVNLYLSRAGLLQVGQQTHPTLEVAVDAIDMSRNFLTTRKIRIKL
jgi:hypothetical protein